MKKNNQLPEDALIGYNNDGVPVPKDGGSARQEVDSPQIVDDGLAPDRPTHEKKRQGTEDAQRRSDTGTGL